MKEITLTVSFEGKSVSRDIGYESPLMVSEEQYGEIVKDILEKLSEN